MHKGAVVQPSDPGRVFKRLGVAKRYCRIHSIGNTFMQYGSVTSVSPHSPGMRWSLSAPMKRSDPLGFDRWPGFPTLHYFGGQFRIWVSRPDLKPVWVAGEG